MSLALIVSIVMAILSSFLGVWIVRRQPSWYSESKMSFLVALSVGLLLAIAFLEFMPHALEQKYGGFFILIGVLGALFFDIFVVPRLSFLDFLKIEEEHHSCHHGSHHQHNHSHLLSQQASCSAMGCLLVCAFFDGFEISSAFMIGRETGALVSLGLFFHILPDGILVASLALAGGLSKKAAQYLSMSVGGSLLSGALLGNFLNQFLMLKSLTLSIATGILIYVCFFHLLSLALKRKHGLWIVMSSSLLFSLLLMMTHGGHHLH